MENLNKLPFHKYQVTIYFEMDEHFMSHVPAHRVIINDFIEKGILDYYSVSMETLRSWMIINAHNKNEVKKSLKQSPLHKYWTIEIDELFVYDSHSYRLPVVQLN